MALNVATGTYVGNGATTGTRAITGIGFQTKCVYVWSGESGSPYPCLMWDSVLTGIGSPALMNFGSNWYNTTTTFDRYQSFDADGFTIACGSNSGIGYQSLNKSGVNYYYVALGGDDCDTGTYTGNNTDNRSITGVGFEPVMVTIMGLKNTHRAWKFGSSGASDSTSVEYNAVDFANGIQAFESDGFQVGTATSPASVNENSTTYAYLAIKSSASVAQSEYTGNGSDDRDISIGGSFELNFILMKTASAQVMCYRNDVPTGDNTKYSGAVWASDIIQSTSVGGFQVGTSALVNGSGNTDRYIAFTSATAPTASIKSVNGLAKASIKSWNGVILK